MKRFKSCLFECEHAIKNGCFNPKNYCPLIEFSGGDFCKFCVYSIPRDGELCCNLVFELFDCPYGVENPLPKEELKQYRNEHLLLNEKKKIL